ncbi:MAG: hypothetical protein ACR2HO_07120, partial [Rubrobacteraceae bacterium]
MTKLPRARGTADDRAPDLPVPELGDPAGPDRRAMSPEARLAADASVGLAVALVLSFALPILPFFQDLSLGLAFFCIAFALAWGLAAPTARLVLGRFLEGWERHVKGLRERGPDWHGP